MAKERVQKILAAAGYGSRRSCEGIIQAGRVRVNGQVIKVGDKADPERDIITLDGVQIRPEEPIYILLNKPRGVISSLEPQGQRQTVRDLVPVAGRIYPVGRLDAESEGLILLTNDGEVANRLTHPRYGHEKEYKVLVDGYPNQKQLKSWQRGVVLDGQWTSRAKVSLIRKGASGTWLRVVMREGRKRQIRRTAQALGLWVKKLQRVRMGPLRLGDLGVGEWRKLTSREIQALKRRR